MFSQNICFVSCIELDLNMHITYSIEAMESLIYYMTADNILLSNITPRNFNDKK